MYSNLSPGGRFKPPDCIARNKVALIIPYRDREEHLRMFLHNMHPILQRQQLDYGIYVIEEVKLFISFLTEFLVLHKLVLTFYTQGPH